MVKPQGAYLAALQQHGGQLLHGGIKEALAKYGTPEIFSTDQGDQFTNSAWIDVLLDAKVKISMDGKGRWIDNRMIERL